MKSQELLISLFTLKAKYTLYIHYFQPHFIYYLRKYFVHSIFFGMRKILLFVYLEQSQDVFVLFPTGIIDVHDFSVLKKINNIFLL